MVVSGVLYAANPQIIKTEFVTPSTAITKGESFTTLTVFHFSPGAHSYWINNGDTGMPPQIEFNLPDGVKLIDTKYQLPHIMKSGNIIDYGYEGTMAIINEFEVDDSYEGGDVTVSMNALLLICKNTCVPDSAKASIDLKYKKSLVGVLPDWDIIQRIESLHTDMPYPYKTTAKAYKTPQGLKLEIKIPKNLNNKFYFFPTEAGLFKNELVQKQESKNGITTLYLNKGPYFSEYPKSLEGVLYSSMPWDLGTQVHGLLIDMPIE